MPIAFRISRKVPLGMSRPPWTGTATGTSVRMPHEVVAALDPRDGEADALEDPDHPCRRYGRDGAGHEAASYQKSGNVECQRQLVRYPDLFNEKLQAGAQIGDCLILRRPVAERGDTGTELSRGTPDAVLVLLDDVGHVNDTSHVLTITVILSSFRRDV